MPRRLIASPPPTERKIATLDQELQLECGTELSGVEIAYRTWGRLNAKGDNAVLVCHALTGGPDLDEWWEPLLGPKRALDPGKDFVVCPNVLGGCYGSTGPTSRSPITGRRYGGSFPPLTVRDMVRAQARLLDAIGVRRLRLVIGGSLGGLQTLEWGAMYPERVDALAPIAASAWHSAWCISLSEAQRRAIFADPRWRRGAYDPSDPPVDGLAAARMIAMISYRSPLSFEQRFGRRRRGADFSAETYLHYQGESLVERFDAATYVTLTRAMDSHDLGRDRGGAAAACARIEQPTLVVSVPTDVLYVPAEQHWLLDHLPNARLVDLESVHGHDAFLMELEELGARVRAFRREIGNLG